MLLANGWSFTSKSHWLDDSAVAMSLGDMRATAIARVLNIRISCTPNALVQARWAHAQHRPNPSKPAHRRLQQVVSRPAMSNTLRT